MIIPHKWGRCSPNLRSAYCSLLGSRAIIHPTIFGKGLAGTVKSFKCGGGIGILLHYTMKLTVRTHTHIFHHSTNGTCLLNNSGNPCCYSAFRRGTVISAVLSWLPMSSDCAFIPEGCSVSSRYTFPSERGAWLGVICRKWSVSHESKERKGGLKEGGEEG